MNRWAWQVNLSSLRLNPPHHLKKWLKESAKQSCWSSAVCWWGEQDSNLRRLSHQIYSLIPLAARESPLGRTSRFRKRTCTVLHSNFSVPAR
jgi:hypothetical protein